MVLAAGLEAQPALPSPAEVGWGGGLGWGTDYSTPTLQARMVWYAGRRWGLSVDMAKYLEFRPGLGLYEANAHLRYRVAPRTRGQAYVLAGPHLQMLRVRRFWAPIVADTGGWWRHVGLNGGGGYERRLPWKSGRWWWFGEARYVLGDADQVMLSMGILSR